MAETPENLLTGLLHDLAHQTLALDELLRQALVSSNDWPTRERPLVRLFQDRVAAGDSPSERELRELLELALQEVDLFGILVSNFLGYATHERRLSLQIQPLLLLHAVQDVVALFLAVAAKRGIEVGIDDHIGDAVVYVDRLLFHRLLVNVLHNAVKYSYDGPGRFIRISLRRHTTQGHHLMMVSSFGVGILEEELRNGAIFEYGVRGALASDRDRTGSGIGLAEARRIAEAHGGTLSVASAHVHDDAYQTTVRIILPPNIR